MAKGFLDGYDTYDTSDGFGNRKRWQHAFRERMTKEDAMELLSGVDDTPHGILGVSLNASKTEIKKAFRKKIAEWHPDRNQHRIGEAETESKRIIAAYTMLTSE